MEERKTSRKKNVFVWYKCVNIQGQLIHVRNDNNNDNLKKYDKIRRQTAIFMMLDI